MIPCIRLFVSICLTGILSAQADVRLTLFDCGSITMTDVSAFSLSNEETDVRELFVPCYLIEHPEGRLIWDAGLPLAMAGAGVIDAGNGITLHYETSIVDQLAAQNLGPDDIDLVALSHTHYDHAGAANVFKSATLLIQKPEYQLAFVDKRNDGIFQYDLIKGLEDSRMLMLEGDHDVFGDGSVTIHRQTADGYDVVQASLPAVVSVTAGVVEPRYPTFKGIMDAKKKPVENLTLTDLDTEAVVGQKVVSITDAVERTAGQKIEDEGEAYLAIVALLEDRKVI